VIISGRAGEEGTPYSARRLYVWARESESWKLLVFQRTFMRARAARLSPVQGEWDLILVDGHGEQFTARTWLAQLNEIRDAALNVRSRRFLHHGETVVVIGDEVSPSTSLSSRFTRVWTRSPQGWQLRVCQTTLAAAEVFGPKR